MRISVIMLIALAMLEVIPGYAQLNTGKVPFKKGEILKYRVHYGLINAAEATITVDDDFHRINNADCYRVNVYGKTTGPFDWVMRVRDTWRTYIDANTLASQKFYRHIEEGNYFTEETTIFDHDRKIARVTERKREGYKKRNKEYNINDYTQDLISGFYFIRSLDFANLKPNDMIPVSAFFEDSTYTADIKYLGMETIRTKYGKKKTHVFTPIVPDNELFEHGENTITVYFSDDRNKIPLKIKAAMFIGSIECDLKSYRGLTESL